MMAMLASLRVAGFEHGAAEIAGRWIASLTRLLLSIGHADVRGTDNVISLGGAALQVSESCSGFELMGILVAAIVAYPVGWKHRLIGAAFVVPFISALNVLRVGTLTLVLYYVPGVFEFCHTFVWQGLLIFGALGYWLIWFNGSPEMRSRSRA